MIFSSKRLRLNRIGKKEMGRPTPCYPLRLISSPILATINPKQKPEDIQLAHASGLAGFIADGN
jgi:hypothetical protein